jgi:predicted ATPase
LAGSFIEATHSVALACIERAGGNPLFLEQLLHNAQEGSEDAVPASIQSLVLARMDRLAQRDRQAFQAAAVIGQRFDLALLRHLIDRPDYVCDGLISNALVLPDEDDFLFAHALIKEGAYSSLLRSRRRELPVAGNCIIRAVDAKERPPRSLFLPPTPQDRTLVQMTFVEHMLNGLRLFL